MNTVLVICAISAAAAIILGSIVLIYTMIKIHKTIMKVNGLIENLSHEIDTVKNINDNINDDANTGI